MFMIAGSVAVIIVIVAGINYALSLGDPAKNWSQERKFRVTAANGKNKDWTIKIVQFRK